MKPFKLLACLVTLQFTSGLTLQAADPQDFRKWTDAGGRTITARFIEAPDAASVKIERQDGRVFVVALKTFSAADQAYVTAFREGATAAVGADVADAAALGDAAASTWTLLDAAGNQPASTYDGTSLAEIITGLNQRFAVKAVKTAAGLPLRVRTEPSDLAARVQLTGDMPGMKLAAFVKEVARINGLTIKTDAAGMVVLVDKPRPASKSSTANYFGVAMNPP